MRACVYLICVCVCVCELIVTPVAICMDNQSIVSLYGQKSGIQVTHNNTTCIDREKKLPVPIMCLSIVFVLVINCD